MQLKIIMPIFRAASTTDGHRVIIVCFLHPIMAEFVSTMNRTGRAKSKYLLSYLKDKTRGHYVLASLM